MKIGHYVQKKHSLPFLNKMAKVKSIAKDFLRLENGDKVKKSQIVKLKDQEIYAKLKKIKRPVYIELEPRSNHFNPCSTKSRILFPDGSVIELEMMNGKYDEITYADWCVSSSEWRDTPSEIALDLRTFEFCMTSPGSYHTVPTHSIIKSLADSIEKMRDSDIRSRIMISHYEVL